MSCPKIERKRKSTRDELENLSKEELINRIFKLEAYNSQLKNTLQKHVAEEETTSKRISQKSRPFDFSKHIRRHVLLKVLYLGWDYLGLATQEHTNRTIEYHLFAALTKGCLVEKRENSNYHRCGRTDKGVSSFSQTVSLDVRSSLTQDEIDSGITEGELPYAKILNRLLPEDIRVLSWVPVSGDFSARFNCKARTYKYFFPRGELDIDLMDDAAHYFLGTHDFRNLCKLDVKNGVVNYIREVSAASVKLCYSDPAGEHSYDVCALTLTGKAFLWHQVRCIMGVLVLVGQRHEVPSIVASLLDVEKYPCKPQYNMACDLPLNLFACEYEEFGTEVSDADSLQNVARTLQCMWGQRAVQAAMLRNMLSCLQDSGIAPNAQADWLLMGVKPHVYRPLLNRPTCESLEGRIHHYNKKQRLDQGDTIVTDVCDSSNND